METKKIIAGITAVGITLASITGMIISGNIANDANEKLSITQSMLTDKVDEYNELVDNIEKIETQINTVKDVNTKTIKELQETKAKLNEFNLTINEKDKEIAKLHEQIAKEVEEEVVSEDNNTNISNDIETNETVETVSYEYMVEDVNLTSNFSETIDGNDFELLQIGELEYNGDDFDFEEEIIITSDVKPAYNLDDIGSNIAIELSENSIEYKYTFAEGVNVTSDEILEINFLGKPLHIASYDTNEITYLTSKEYSLTIGDNVSIDDNIVELLGVDENNKVLLKVNDDITTLQEGSTITKYDVSIKANEVFYSSLNDAVLVKLNIGKDISEKVDDGDEYKEMENFEWKITTDSNGLVSVGIVLVEDFTEEDEVLLEGDKIVFPNEYFTLTNVGTKEMEVINLDISVRSDEINVEYDGIIEIDEKKIDDSEFKVINESGNMSYEYTYNDNDKNNTDFSLIKIINDDREVTFDVNTTDIIIDSYVFGYVFSIKEITSGPSFISDEEDKINSNGDIIYKSDITDADEEETSISIGLVNDEDKEILLSFNN